MVTVEGRVSNVTGDTVMLRLTNVSQASDSTKRSVYEGALATVVLEPRTVIERREVSGGRTALAVGGGVVALVGIGVIIVAVALASLLSGA